MNSLKYLVLFAVLLAACSTAPSGNAVQTAVAGTIAAQQKQISSPVAQQLTNTTAPTLPPKPTYTSYPTYTQYPTLEPYPTYTPYPKPTEIPLTETLEVTNTPEPTINPELTTDKTEGGWLVGSEVAAGLWRASGDCYAVTRDKNGDQLDMASGSRSIITVPPSVFTVEFVSYPDTCTWSYLGK